MWGRDSWRQRGISPNPMKNHAPPSLFVHSLTLVWHSTPMQKTISLHQPWVFVMIYLNIFFKIIVATVTIHNNMQKQVILKLTTSYYIFGIEGKDVCICLFVPFPIHLPERSAFRPLWPCVSDWVADPDQHKADQSWHCGVTAPHSSTSKAWTCWGQTEEKEKKNTN